MRVPRLLLLLALALSPLLAQGGGGGSWGSNGGRVIERLQGYTGHAQITSIRWTARSGRSKTILLPRPVDLFASPALVAPPGEWVDVTLLLDGPLTLSGQTEAGQAFDWILDVPAFTVALDQPVQSEGDALVRVSLALPDGPLPAWVRPGQAAQAALIVALQDGARAVE